MSEYYCGGGTRQDRGCVKILTGHTARRHLGNIPDSDSSSKSNSFENSYAQNIIPRSQRQFVHLKWSNTGHGSRKSGWIGHIKCLSDSYRKPNITPGHVPLIKPFQLNINSNLTLRRSRRRPAPADRLDNGILAAPRKGARKTKSCAHGKKVARNNKSRLPAWPACPDFPSGLLGVNHRFGPVEGARQITCVPLKPFKLRLSAVDAVPTPKSQGWPTGPIVQLAAEAILVAISHLADPPDSRKSEYDRFSMGREEAGAPSKGRLQQLFVVPKIGNDVGNLDADVGDQQESGCRFSTKCDQAMSLERWTKTSAKLLKGLDGKPEEPHHSKGFPNRSSDR
ncbi:hypothetical protein C8F04DRAFT_1183642 [Mycena alexandri]|uniref:Uncharacterized protein n=1 Tax=Mycena alexandri TaxID=1745969 RepID=A0AAD6SWB4_9AGAR|nr:hypothetical protein C8F04DRAFT_1183642 [Mycena alexandri]